MANGDYGYFGKGNTGYAQYMTAFNRNFGGSFACRCFSARGKRGILRAENRNIWRGKVWQEHRKKSSYC